MTAIQMIDPNHARVLITYKGVSTEMPDPVDRESTDAAVRTMVAEAISSGSIPGIVAEQANLQDFMLDRYPPTEDRPYSIISLRPKTPFGAGNEITRIVQVAYHRNGVSGTGFHAVLFTINYEACPTCHDAWGWTSGNGIVSCSKGHDGPPVVSERLMVASVFPEEGSVAVYAVKELNDPEIGVAFGTSKGNSWRGDRYEARLRKAIDEEVSDGSFKLGPFGIPTERRPHD